MLMGIGRVASHAQSGASYGPAPSGVGSGWWKLSENIGTSAADSSGQNHSMALTGWSASVPPASPWGTLSAGTPAVVFGGANGQLAKAAAVSLNSAGYTLTATVNLSSSMTGNPVVLESRSAPGDIAASISLSNDPAQGWALQGVVKTSTQTVYPWGGYSLPTGQDVRLAMTVGSGSIKLYVNGVLKGTTVYTGTPTSGSDFVVGSDWWGATSSGSAFKGQIADSRVFNTALTATDVAAITTPASWTGTTATTTTTAAASGCPTATTTTAPAGGGAAVGVQPSGTGSGWWKFAEGNGTSSVDSADFSGSHTMQLTGWTGSPWGNLGSGTSAVSFGQTNGQLAKATGVTLSAAGYTLTSTVNVNAAMTGNPYVVQSRSAPGDIAAAMSLSKDATQGWALQGIVKTTTQTVYPWGGYVIPTGQDLRLAMTVGGGSTKL
jgi:hypothetical protein